ncbi:MAG: hypothetical protein OER83_07470 [Flavobacteriaceae bacterium]|nr:hypothetical protein [Flavobacteriaceae bacterium]MDH3796695.1 hypothetical protein [Flavobacteriaceae bacterium]
MFHGIRLFVGLCLFCSFTAGVQAQELTAQQKERQAEINKTPRLFVYDSTYLISLQAERENFLRTKALIDCLKISDKKREKLIRDLYRHKRSKRLNKILLATTTFVNEPDRDPEQ